MPSGTPSYALLGGLAIALLVAAATDIRRREIDNWLTGGIALAAPLYWLSSGMGGIDLVLQLAVALVAVATLFALFAAGAIGGGDVKLLGALALWLAPFAFARLLVVMALAGGLLTVACAVRHQLERRVGRVAVPYGVAISAAGLWTLATIAVPTLRETRFPW